MLYFSGYPTLTKIPEEEKSSNNKNKHPKNWNNCTKFGKSMAFQIMRINMFKSSQAKNQSWKGCDWNNRQNKTSNSGLTNGLILSWFWISHISLILSKFVTNDKIAYHFSYNLPPYIFLKDDTINLC